MNSDSFAKSLNKKDDIETPYIVNTVINKNIVVNQIKLNQTTLQYIRHSMPVKINNCISEGDSYRFDLSIQALESFQLNGHSALTIKNSETQTDIEAKRIQIIVITFKQTAIQEAMKAKYGIHYNSIPWISKLDEDFTPNTLLQSLSNWIIQELEKKSTPLKIAWIHLEKALLDLFIINLDRRNSTRHEENIIKRSWFIDLEKWVSNNLTNTIAMDDLALVAGVSKRAIQKAFREYRNCTPMEAITQQRLLKAREMLLNQEKDITVLDVAMSLGYLHPSRFASNYKKKFGENPSETIALSRKETNNSK